MKLLDTSYLIDFERGREPARQYFEANEHVSFAVSTISLFELAFGVVWSGNGSLDELATSLEWADFLSLSVLDALEGARVQGELQASGERLPIVDVMLAGVARNRGATLVSADDHFDRVDGLTVETYRS